MGWDPVSWMLVVWLSGHPSTIVVLDEYRTEERCVEAAGHLEGRWTDPTWRCVPSHSREGG